MTQPLHQLVDEFTKEHTIQVEQDDGSYQRVRAMSYLDQLYQAKNANRGTGSSSSSTRSPIALSAVDLIIKINKTTNQNQPQDWKTPPPPDLGGRIRRWMAATLETGKQDEMYQHLQSWKSQIQAMTTPTITLDAACPRCDQKYKWEYNGAETTRINLLTYNKHRASCAGCHALWEGKSQMVGLSMELNHGKPLNGSLAHSTSSL